MQIYGQQTDFDRDVVIPVNQDNIQSVLSYLNRKGFTCQDGNSLIGNAYTGPSIRSIVLFEDSVALQSRAIRTEDTASVQIIIPEEPMTNHEILELFLREHRVLTEYRKQVKRSSSLLFRGKVYAKYSLTYPINWFNPDSIGSIRWQALNREWEMLCERFNLVGTIDCTKI